jgi:hypothetical protein
MNVRLSHWSAGVMAALFSASAWSCHAVTISYVGTEPGGAGSGYVTENWSNPAVAKSFATGTSNTYGKDGYWQIRPNTGTDLVEGVAGGNNLGTSASPFPTLWMGSNPSFMSSIEGAAGNFVNFGGYPDYRGPDGSSLYRQGALSVPVAEGPYSTPGEPTYAGQTLSFTLTYSGTVRVGFAVDSVGTALYAPNYVGIYSPTLTPNTTLSAALTRDGVPDMAIFDIVNPTGQTFYVAQWQTAGTQSVSAMSLVTFDLIPVPEPSTVGLLAAAGVVGGLVVRRRRSPIA